MKRLLFSESARADLRDIWSYIAADSENAADAVLDQIKEEILRIAAAPRIGHRRRDLTGDMDYLFWRCGHYLLIYTDDPDAVAILAILHASRDIPAVLRDRVEDVPD